MALSFFPLSELVFSLPVAADGACLCCLCLLAESFPLTLGGAMLFWVSPDVIETTLLLLIGVVVFRGEGAVTASSGNLEVAGDGMMV